MGSSVSITTDTLFELLGNGSDSSCAVPVHTTLTYTSGDPFAIRMLFAAGPGREIEWVLSRELLAAGLVDGAGEGDIAIYPMLTRPGYVEVKLSSPTGIAYFAARPEGLQAFLHRTYAAVPAGDETDQVDVDGELADLLGAEGVQG